MILAGIWGIELTDTGVFAIMITITNPKNPKTEEKWL